MTSSSSNFLAASRKTGTIIEKSPTPLAFDVVVGMFLQDEMTSGADFSGSHNALAVHNRPPAPAPTPGGALGSHTRLPDLGSGSGKLGSPLSNQGSNKHRRFTNIGGYQGASNSPPSWTGNVYSYLVVLPPSPRPSPWILEPRPALAYSSYAPLHYGGCAVWPLHAGLWGVGGGRRMARFLCHRNTCRCTSRPRVPRTPLLWITTR